MTDRHCCIFIKRKPLIILPFFFPQSYHHHHHQYTYFFCLKKKKLIESILFLWINIYIYMDKKIPRVIFLLFNFQKGFFDNVHVCDATDFTSFSRIQILVVKTWKGVILSWKKRTVRSITFPSGVFPEFQSALYLFYARLRDFDRVAK